MASGSNGPTVAVLKSSKVIWQQNQQADRFGFERRDSRASLTFKVGRASHREEREIKLEPEAVRSALARYGGEKIAKSALRNSVEEPCHRD